MSEDNVALIITVGFFVWMVAWALLVEHCGRKLGGCSESKETSRVIEKKHETQAKKGSGYEAAVVIVMLTAIGSLSLVLN